MRLAMDGDDLLLFVMILSRIAGIMTTGPILGERAVPMQLRVGLAAMLSFIAFPVVRGNMGALDTELLGSGMQLAAPTLVFAVIAKETMLGLAIGYAARLLFYALQMAAYMADFQMGLGMAGLYDPSLGAQVSPVGSLVNWAAMMVFLAIGGHHRLIQTLIGSFDRLPLGMDWGDKGGTVLGFMAEHIAYSVQVAIGLFAPVLLVLGVAELALGFMSKAAPQMNILTLSMPLKVGLGIVAFLLWIGTLSGPLGHAFGAELGGVAKFLGVLAR